MPSVSTIAFQQPTGPTNGSSTMSVFTATINTTNQVKTQAKPQEQSTTTITTTQPTTATKPVAKKPAKPPSSWDPQDDILLRFLKEEKKLGWKEIASHFTTRTPNACQFRWRRLMSGSVKQPQNSNGSSGSSASSTANSTPQSTNATPATSASPQIQPQRHSSHSPSPVELLVGLGSSRTQEKRPRESSTSVPWTQDEDDIIAAPTLRFEEINVLLPSRSETELRNRFNLLRNLKTSPETPREAPQVKRAKVASTGLAGLLAADRAILPPLGSLPRAAPTPLPPFDTLSRSVDSYSHKMPSIANLLHY